MPYSDTDEDYDLGNGPPMLRQVYDWYQKNASPIGDMARQEYERRQQNPQRYVPQTPDYPLQPIANIPSNIINFAGNQVAAPALKSMNETYQTDWSQQPFIGIGEHGEFTGRLPAISSYVAPYLLGAAPGGQGVLPAGAKLPGFDYGYAEGLEGGFHGTGTRFPPTAKNVLGEFDPKFYRSGTGGLSEGAGFYIASQWPVGEEYRRFISGGIRGGVPLTPGGRPIEGMDLIEKYYDPGQIVPLGGSEYGRVERFYKPVNPANAKYWRSEIRPVTLSDEAIEKGLTPTQAMHDPKLWDDLNKDFVIHRDEPIGYDVDKVGKARGWEIGEPGSLYHVEIKPPEDTILHWNKPFSEQTPFVQDTLKAALKKHGYGDNRFNDFMANNPTGKDIYNTLVEDVHPQHTSVGADPEMTAAKHAVSKSLDEAGIPGLKYHDDFSTPNITFNGHKIENYDDALKALGMERSNANTFEPRVEVLQSVLEHNGNVNESLKSFKADLRYLKSDPEHYQSSVRGDYAYTEEGIEAAIKWLEQNRGKIGQDTSQYNHNYVIFDPRHLNIIHRENHLKGVGGVI